MKTRVRIISGSLRGHRLAGFGRNLPIRPMTDRVKESVFGTLTPFFHGDVLFLDMFSGTGALSLEALSRGAKTAHAVESHPGAFKILEKNRRILPRPESLILHKQEVFSFIKTRRGEPFDIIIADPPFAMKAGNRLLEKTAKSALYRKGTVVVIETAGTETLKKQLQPFTLFSKKDFGDKQVWFYEAK